MKSATRLFVIALAATLCGCNATVPVNYAPSSSLTASGNVAVGPFAYLPATSGKVKPNQIRNTAVGNIYFEQSIDVMLRDAVFKELRVMGIKVDDQPRKLTGEIQEFLIDDLGYSVDWTLTIKYRVEDPSGATYEAVKELKRHTSKFTNVFGALNETIKLNVEELAKDPAFLAAIK